jgi:hypothetical protein
MLAGLFGRALGAVDRLGKPLGASTGLVDVLVDRV